MAKYDHTTGAWYGHTEEELDELEKQETEVYVTKPCPVCGQTTTFNLCKYNLNRWKEGRLIQDAFPEMPPENRETMINGLHPECWEKLFGGGDE